MNVVAEKGVDARHKRKTLTRPVCFRKGATLWAQENAAEFVRLGAWNQNAVYVTKAYAELA
ncbi:MAG: hypothetical protein JRE63_09275 [Deltaproteobacteria bacterium]|jgi:hypothetical protein|nr:hypothetical protein [Deltaproteobacteria bacterium]